MLRLNPFSQCGTHCSSNTPFLLILSNIVIHTKVITIAITSIFFMISIDTFFACWYCHQLHYHHQQQCCKFIWFLMCDTTPTLIVRHFAIFLSLLLLFVLPPVNWFESFYVTINCCYEIVLLNALLLCHICCHHWLSCVLCVVSCPPP